MLPKYIKVKDFTSYIDEVINFEDYDDLFAVVGNNGSGKSSIIDMITTTLFYQNRSTDSRGVGMDNMIRNGADLFEIEFAFDMNNVSYKIVRRKYRDGAHELEFYVDDLNQSENLVTTQSKIYKVLKMDYDTFLDTTCIWQGKSNSFMEKKPDKRKDVFVQVLGLGKYEELEDYAKNLRKETKESIEKLEARITDLQLVINLKSTYQKQLDDGNCNITILGNQIKTKETELEKVLKEKVQYEQIMKQRSLILDQRTNLANKITTFNESIKKNEELKTSYQDKIKTKDELQIKLTQTQQLINNLQDEYTNVSNQKSSLEATNSILTNQAKDCKAKYDNLKNYNQAKCSFCGGDITPDFKKQFLTELMNDGKKYLNDVNTNKTMINQLTSELVSINNSLTINRTSLNQTQQSLTNILQIETRLNVLETKIIQDINDLKDYSEQYNKNIEIVIEPLESKQFNDEQIRVELNTLRSQLTSWQSKVTLAQNELSKIDKAETDLTDCTKELTSLQVLHDDYDSLVTAYGKSGIQADIIANALPEIEDEINNLLEILSGNVSIEFRTQKETKTKKKGKVPTSIETLDIIINDETGSRVYESYSGGEKFRVDFACHVGLSKFLAKRAGATIDFFIIDEGLGSQDQTAISHFINCVYKLANVFKKVMIITHILEVQDAFNSKVLVYKDSLEGSKVKLLN
jgi:DNA repair exonuclease SbcCD ATPase subunit